MEMVKHSLALIFGYFSKQDQISKTAREKKHLNRMALAFDGVRGENNLYFDAPVFLPILLAALGVFDRDEIFLIDAAKNEMRFHSVSEMEKHYLNIWKDDEEKSAFLSVELCLGGVSQCVLELSPFASFGGEFPYTDTFTYNLYFKQDVKALRIPIQKFILEQCLKRNVFVRDLLTGTTRPQNSFFARFSR